MSLELQIDRSIPAHVPEAQIMDWPLRFGESYKGNPYKDLIDPIHAKYPDIFGAAQA